MCGIAGLWIADKVNLKGHLRAMISRLVHRGPDQNGFWGDCDSSLVMGHTRLSILDLTEQGKQPMLSPDGRYVLVFNGEIYNHNEIRGALGNKVPWRGSSDTETLLGAIDEWGLQEALRISVGMFAIALWDRKERKLSLARDRMGEKPLYVASVPGGIAFASEIKSLREYNSTDLSLDSSALIDYMHLGYVPGDQTAFAHIRKIPKGKICIYHSPVKEAVQHDYWTFPSPKLNDSSISLDDVEVIKEFEGLLDRSIREQMLADVPVGAFLSGGIDSSLIAAMMQRASSTPINTFTMGFTGYSGDEAGHARKVANFLGANHTEINIEPKNVIDAVPLMAEIYDEPFADSSQIPTFLLSKLARQHVTVALSGDGGDELFGGYNRYLAAEKLALVFKHLPFNFRKGVAATLRFIPSNAFDVMSKQVSRVAGFQLPSDVGEKVGRIASFLDARDGKGAYLNAISRWQSANEMPILGCLKGIHLPDCDHPSLAQCMMWWDMQTYLPDDILVKVDRASMAASLETRVPLLDYRLVEFALRTPMHFKIRNGETKWIMRALLKKFIPPTLFERPKQGFGLPLGEWLRGPLRGWAESLLESNKIQKTGFLDPVAVSRIWREHCRGIVNHEKGLWTILMLQAWLENLDAFKNKRI